MFKGNRILVRHNKSSSYPGFELSRVRVIQGSSYPGFELSRVRVKRSILYDVLTGSFFARGGVVICVDKRRCRDVCSQGEVS